MTGRPESTLATLSDVHLCVRVRTGSLSFRPGSHSQHHSNLGYGRRYSRSPLGCRRGFSADDFALSHPGGSLGPSFVVTIGRCDAFGDALPVVHQQVSLKEALLEISRKGLGLTSV